jgi:hypothetical protein
MHHTGRPAGGLAEQASDMNCTPSNHRMQAPVSASRPRLWPRLLPWALAFAALGAGAQTAAGDTPRALANVPPSSLSTAAGLPAVHAGTSRAEVRESLRTAMAAGLMLRAGEIAEPPSLQQAREDFNAMQTEQLHKAHRATVEENERLARAARDTQASVPTGADDARLAQRVDEATDRLPALPDEVEIWVQPDTTMEELVAYIEQTGNPDAVVVVMVEGALPEDSD